MKPPKWEALEAEVIEKIRMLRVCWEASDKEDTVMNRALKRDLYIPAIEQLALFCVCIEVEDSPPDTDTVQ